MHSLQRLTYFTDKPEEKGEGGQVFDPPETRQSIDQYAEKSGPSQVRTGHRLGDVSPQRGAVNGSIGQPLPPGEERHDHDRRGRDGDPEPGLPGLNTKD